MRTVALGEVAEINPRSYSAGPPSAATAVSFVPMQAVDERFGRITALEDRPFASVQKGYTSFQDGDVLFAKITPCMENGKAALATNLRTGRAAGSTEFHVLRPRDGEVLSGYLFHFVRRERFRQLCKRNFTGTAGQQRVPKAFLETCQLRLPSLAEQRVIVERLDAAAAIRRRAEAARDKARALTQALFLDMFGDPSISEITLDAVSTIQSGITKGRKLNGAETTSVPYLRVKNIQDGGLDLSEIKLIEATVAEQRRFSLQINDLLMTEGGDADKLGRCALWSGPIDGCIHQNHVFRVRVDRDQLNPVFAAAYMRTDAAKSYFLRVAKRTTGIASINKTQLGKTPVPLPQLRLQKAFADCAALVEAATNEMNAVVAKAEAAAAALSAEVFG